MVGLDASKQRSDNTNVARLRLPVRNFAAMNSAVTYGVNYGRHLRATDNAINAADAADAAAQVHPKLVGYNSKFQEPPAAGQCDRLVDLWAALPVGATQIYYALMSEPGSYCLDLDDMRFQAVAS